jgi:hypothetical protein
VSQFLFAVGGAAVGALSTLTIELVKRRWDKKSAAEQLIRKYRDPLLQAAFGLQSRLYNIVHLSFLDFTKSKSEDEKTYARDSTLWHFAEYLGWAEILRREVQFLDLGTVSKNKRLQKRLGAIASALASDDNGFLPTFYVSADKPTRPPTGPRFIVFRDDQRAIGEVMVRERPLPDETKTAGCLDYSEFVKKVESARNAKETDPFSRWCRRFDADLGTFASAGWDSRHPRLIEIQRRLIDLVDLLDAKQERFPNRDGRGKLRRVSSEKRPRYQVARFIDATTPTPIVEEWAKQNGLWKEVEGLYRGRRGLGVEPVVSVSWEKRRIAIEAWTRAPIWLRYLRRIVGSSGWGAQPSETDWGNRGLEQNGLLFWNSRRRARNTTNDLLRRFDRPIIVADSIARRQWAFLALSCVGALVLLLGWPGWVRDAVAAPAETAHSAAAPTTIPSRTTVPPVTTAKTATAPVASTVRTTITTTVPTTVTATAVETVGSTVVKTVTTGTAAKPIVDAIAPVATIALPGNTRGWQDLAGAVTDRAPTAGLRGVEVSIVRTGRSHCSAYTGFRFSKLACGEAFRVWLGAHVSGDRWSFRIRGLPPGEYVFRARATDAAGNQQRPPAVRFVSFRSTH